ncbi:MAG: response regulator [bacterium]|nr:response regulator [bacterium]
MKKPKVLVVDDWGGWHGATSVLDLGEQATLQCVATTGEAGEFFNGEPKADILIISAVKDIVEFVKGVRKRFPRLPIIGLTEHRDALSNLGCNVFVNRGTLGVSITAFLGKCHR